MFVGIVVLLLQGQVIPMIEAFPDEATCKKVVAEAKVNIEKKSGGEVISAKCVKAD